MSTRHSRSAVAALLLILLLAFALRLVRVGELRMWGDEAYSVYSANRSLTAITFEGAENDPHPPLYYYLLHFYLPLAGASEMALRFFSVFPGVATVATLYVIGKRLFDSPTGLVAAALAASAPFDVYYSQEIRMYALAIFLTTLGLYFFVRLMSSPSDKRLWLAYAVAMALALYTVYHAAFVFLAEGIFLLTLVKRRRELVVRWFAVATGIVLLFVPWLLFRFWSTLGHLEERAGRTVQSLPVFVARGWAALTVGTTIPVNNALLLAVFFAALVVLGVVVAVGKRTWTWRDWLIVALVAIPMVAIYPLYLLLPILVARLFALAFAPLVLLVARSLRQFDRRVGLACAVVIAAVYAYSLDDYYFRFDRYNAAAEDYIPVIQSVEAGAQSGDVVLFHAYWQIGYFLSHYQGPPVEYRLLDRAEDLVAAVARPRNIWAVVQDLPLHGSEVWLAQNAYPMGEQKYGLMRLVAFRAETPPLGEEFPSPVMFSNGMALRGYRVSSGPLESGNGLALLELDWQAPQKIAGDYTVSVRLTGADGSRIWAQEDGQPASGTRRTSEWQPNETVADRHTLGIPSGTPPGNYAIQVVLYDSATGRPANIVAPENRRAQAFLTAPLSITRPTVPVSEPRIANPVDAAWQELALAGFDIGSKELMQGDTLPMTLYWRARQKPTRDYLVQLLVVDSEGGWRASAMDRPAGDALPTPQWNAGDFWTQKVQLTLDAGSAPGTATVLLFVTDAAVDDTLPVQTGAPTRDLTIKGMVSPGNRVVHAVPLTTLSISGRTRQTAMPSPQHPMQVSFSDRIKLLGYDLNAEIVKPGDTLNLGVYWQPLDRLYRRYAVFVHLLDVSGALVAQVDSEPQSGNAPTTSWLPPEVIADRYATQLPSNLVPGKYTLEIGLYERDTGRRLSVDGASGDSLVLQQITVAAR